MDQDLQLLVQRLEQDVLQQLRDQAGRTGVPLHPKYGWGGFLDLKDRTAAAVERWNIHASSAPGPRDPMQFSKQ
jgi:hypothetical protein